VVFDQVLKHERRVQWMKFKLGWAQQIFDARIPVRNTPSCFSTFSMLVPSLSWQNDRLL
jgi:hypothetical protein